MYAQFKDKEISKRLQPADYLRNLRQAAGWTQHELGDKIEVSPQRVNDYEIHFLK